VESFVVSCCLEAILGPGGGRVVKFKRRDDEAGLPGAAAVELRKTWASMLSVGLTEESCVRSLSSRYSQQTSRGHDDGAAGRSRSALFENCFGSELGIVDDEHEGEGATRRRYVSRADAERAASIINLALFYAHESLDRGEDASWATGISSR
jgi:hypothetical protein